MAKTTAKKAAAKSAQPEPPEWQGLSKKEIKETVIKFAREGRPAAMIGQILRDSYGVPSVKLATGQRVGEILADADVAPKMPDDLQNLIKKVIVLQEHLAERRKDLHNRRAMTLVESRIRSLASYYKRIGRLPDTWTYNSETARLLVE